MNSFVPLIVAQHGEGSSSLPLLGFVLGTVLVVLFAWKYFSETKVLVDSEENEEVDLLPFTAQASTVKGRFILWRIAFSCSVVTVYWILLYFFGSAPRLEIPAPVQLNFGEMLAPLLATNAFVLALIVTGAIPNTPYLNLVFEFLRSGMHARARIPERFHSVYSTLQKKIIPADKTLRQAAIAIEPTLVTVDDFLSEDDSSARYWFARILYLTAFINHLRGSDPRKVTYRSALNVYEPQLRRLNMQFDESKGVLRSLGAGIPIEHHVLLRRRLRGICLRLLQICIAAVFTSEFIDSKALEKLSVLNSDLVEDTHPSPPYDYCVVSCVFIFVLGFLIMAVLKAFEIGMLNMNRPEFREAFVGACIATLIMPLPALLVAVAKNNLQTFWPYRLQGQRRAFLPYVACAICAYGLGLGVLKLGLSAGKLEFETLGNEAAYGFAVIAGAFGVVSALCMDVSRELWGTLYLKQKITRTAVACGVSAVIMTCGSLVGVAIAFAMYKSSSAPEIMQPADAWATFWHFTKTTSIVTIGITICHVAYVFYATKRELAFRTSRELKRHVLLQAGIMYDDRLKEPDLNELLKLNWMDIPDHLRLSLVKGRLFTSDGLVV